MNWVAWVFSNPGILCFYLSAKYFLLFFGFCTGDLENYFIFSLGMFGVKIFA